MGASEIQNRCKLEVILCMGRGSSGQLFEPKHNHEFNKLPCTVASRYYGTAGIRKKYHNIQTIELSGIDF